MTDESRNNPPTCPDCGTEIPTGTPEGMCPQCLLGGGLDPDGETLPSNPANPSRNPVQKLESAGSSVGRYKLLQQIGEGGFGTVYLAEQTEPVKRQVALKVIKAGHGLEGGHRALRGRAPGARADGSPEHRARSTTPAPPTAGGRTS